MKLIQASVPLMFFPWLLVGCGLSTFTQRETDPYIRDVVFNQTQPVAITVTDSSRRLVYEFKLPGRRHVICADASPDTSIAASGVIGGEVSVTEGQANGKLSGQRTSSTSTLPLVRRSQGLQWGRDNAALECMLYAMGVTPDAAAYRNRLDDIRKQAKEIIEKEIEKGLGELQLGAKNDSPNPPAAGSSADDGASSSESAANNDK